MCGRYGLNVDANDLMRVYQAIGRDIEEWTPRYSVAPSNTVPILIALPGELPTEIPAPQEPAAARTREPAVARALEPAVWGFRPFWAKEGRPRPINARLETVATNGMFRSSFRAHRAIVPMTGYYEWTPGPGRTKIPHWIHADGALLHAAAVTTSGRSEEGEARTVAIVTTTGTDRAGEIHDRMPVFMTADCLDDWLAPGKLEPQEGEELVHLAADQARRVASSLSSYRVSPRVNSVARIDPHDPTLIDPAETLF